MEAGTHVHNHGGMNMPTSPHLFMLQLFLREHLQARSIGWFCSDTRQAAPMEPRRQMLTTPPSLAAGSALAHYPLIPVTGWNWWSPPSCARPHPELLCGLPAYRRWSAAEPLHSPRQSASLSTCAVPASAPIAMLSYL